MFLLILSTILGLMGLIPPEHFAAWREAMVWDLVIEMIALFVWLFFGYYIRRFIYRLFNKDHYKDEDDD